MTDKKKLLVIDDNSGFLKQIKADLEKDFKIYCQNSLEDIKYDQIQSFNPDVLLLDLNLQQSGYSRNLLETLSSKSYIRIDCQVWLISQILPSSVEDRLNNYRAVHGSIQEPILTKAISARQLTAELLGNIFYQASNFKKNMPSPFRVIDKTGRIAFSNQHWLQPLLPSTDNVVDQLDSLVKNEEYQIESQDFVGDFFEIGASGYTLHSFLLEQNDLYFIGQIAERWKQQNSSSKLESALEIIFETMQNANFNRGRFFQVDQLANQDGKGKSSLVLELKGSYMSTTHDPELIQKLNKESLIIPINGLLEKRLKAYKKDKNFNKKLKEKKKGLKEYLLYKIRQIKDDGTQQENDTVSELNYQLNLPTKNFSWLEVPIWICDDNTKEEEDRNYILAGILIFDRFNKTDKSFDLKFDEDTIQHIIAILKSLVCQLTQALSLEKSKKLAEYEKVMKSMDKALTSAQNDDERYQVISDYLCHPVVSGADSAIMTISNGFNELNKLNVVNIADKNKQVPKLLQHFSFSSNDNYHPVVKVWTNPKLPHLAYQDFTNNCEDQQILVKKLKNNKKEELANWVNQHIKSLLIMPVDIGKNKDRLGGIALQFPKKHMIKEQTLVRIRALLQRVRWVIMYAQQQEEQFTWEIALGHEFNSIISEAEQRMLFLKDEIDEVYNQDLKERMELQYDAVEAQLKAAEDHAFGWMELRRDPNQSLNKITPINALTPINDYIKINKARLDFDKIILTELPFTIPIKSCSVKDTAKKHYGYVVRILLDNAFKFGRLYINKIDEDQSLTITLEYSEDLDFFYFNVINPSELDAKEQQNLYEARTFIPKDETKTRGAHLGLFTAKKTVNSFGGELDIHEITIKEQSFVKAQLKWPKYND